MSILEQSIDILELSVRGQNVLRYAGIKNLYTLVRTKESDLVQYKNCGSGTLREIKKSLKEFNLSLRSEWTQLKIRCNNCNDEILLEIIQKGGK